MDFCFNKSQQYDVATEKANAPFECGNRQIIVQITKVSGLLPGDGWDNPSVLYSALRN